MEELIKQNRFLVEAFSDRLFFVVNRFDYFGQKNEAEKIKTAIDKAWQFVNDAIINAVGGPCKDRNDWISKDQFHLTSALNAYRYRCLQNKTMSKEGLLDWENFCDRHFFGNEDIINKYQSSLLARSGVPEFGKFFTHIFKHLIHLIHF